MITVWTHRTNSNLFFLLWMKSTNISLILLIMVHPRFKGYMKGRIAGKERSWNWDIHKHMYKYNYCPFSTLQNCRMHAFLWTDKFSVIRNSSQTSFHTYAYKMHKYILTHIHTYRHSYSYIQAHPYPSIHVHVYSTYIYMYILATVHTCKHTFIYTYSTYIHVHLYTHICIYTYMYVYIHRSTFSYQNSHDRLTLTSILKSFLHKIIEPMYHQTLLLS